MFWKEETNANPQWRAALVSGGRGVPLTVRGNLESARGLRGRISKKEKAELYISPFSSASLTFLLQLRRKKLRQSGNTVAAELTAQLTPITCFFV